MRKLRRWLEDSLVDFAAFGFCIALFAASLGTAIWSVKWVLRLLEVI